MRRLFVVVALGAALAFPAAVTADTIGGFGEPPPAGSSGGMTIEYSNLRLIGRLVVTMDVTLTCQPKPPNEYPIYSYWENYGLQAWVKQANGRSIAFAFRDLYFNADETCDGTPHQFPVSMSADVSSVPFRNGSAVVAVAGYASYGWENWDDGSSGYVNAGASTGWVKVRLRS